MPTKIEDVLKKLYPNMDTMSEEDRKRYEKDVAFLEKYFDKFCEAYTLWKGIVEKVQNHKYDFSEDLADANFLMDVLEMTRNTYDTERIINNCSNSFLEFMNENAIVTESFDVFRDILLFDRQKQEEYKDIPVDHTPIKLKTVLALTKEFLAEVDESGELLAEFNKLEQNDGIVIYKSTDEKKSAYEENKIQYVYDGTVNTASTLVHEFMHHWCDLKGQTSMSYYNYTTVREYLSIYYENAFIRFMDDKGLLKKGERPLLADRLQKEYKKDPQNAMIPLFELANKKRDGEIDEEAIVEVLQNYCDETSESKEVWEIGTKRILDFQDTYYSSRDVVTGFSAYRFCTGLAHYTSLEPKYVKSIFKLAEHVKDGKHDPIFLQEYLKMVEKEEFSFPLEETPDLAGANRGEKVIPMFSVDSIAKRVMPATNFEDKNFIGKIFGRWKDKFLERIGEAKDDK